MSPRVWPRKNSGELRSPGETSCMSAGLIGVKGARGQDDAGCVRPPRHDNSLKCQMKRAEL